MTFKARPEAFIKQNYFGIDRLYFSFPVFQNPVINLNVQNNAYKVLVNHPELFTNHFKIENLYFKILLIAQNGAKKAVDKGDEAMLEMALKGYEVVDTFSNKLKYQLRDTMPSIYLNTSIWIPFAHEIDMGFATNAKRAFYLTTGQTEKYRMVMDDYIHSIWDDPLNLTRMAYRYLNWYDEDWLLVRGKSWVKRAHEIEPYFFSKAVYALYMNAFERKDEYRSWKEEALNEATEEDKSMHVFRALDE